MSSKVTSWTNRSDILHLWVFPNASCHASGTTYDGGNFSLAPTSAGACRFNAATLPSISPVLVLQLPWNSAPTAVVDSSGRSLPNAGAWPDIASYRLRHQPSSWTYDSVQRTVWIRLQVSS